MKFTIFGATGLLGRALVAVCERRVTAVSSKDADVRDIRQVNEIVKRDQPDWVIMAAAFTDVDGCESMPEKAFAVNRDGAVNVALATKQVGARLVFVSTDYVFDGTKAAPYEVHDPRSPLSVYGRSKAEAEVEILKVLPDCCIVRTSWLFGVGGKCFPDTILRLAGTRPALDVVNDQIGCPTYVPHLAAAIRVLCETDACGIVHATNTGLCSWWDFACEIVRRAAPGIVVRPVGTTAFPRPARRPQYSVLSPVSLERRGISMPLWQDALDSYLQERRRCCSKKAAEGP